MPNLTPLLFIVFLPIFPAYVLFRLLPSSAWVEGPFQGLRINVSGGFAAFFLVFIALLGTRKNWVAPSYEKWTVTGRVEMEGKAPVKYLDANFVTFSSHSLISTDAMGNITCVFIRSRDGQFQYPKLYIDYPGYYPKNIYLGPKDSNFDNDMLLPQHVDENLRTIDLGEITLHKIPVLTGGHLPTTAANPYQAQ